MHYAEDNETLLTNELVFRHICNGLGVIMTVRKAFIVSTG